MARGALTMGNMTVADILDELGGYGAVTLRKGKFSVGASPHLRGRPELWVIEVSLPGYSSRYAMSSYVKAEGVTIREAVEGAYAALEAFIFSPEAEEDRQRYEKQNAFYKDRYERATFGRRSGFDPVRHPGEPIPPIVWGERRGGKII